MKKIYFIAALLFPTISFASGGLSDLLSSILAILNNFGIPLVFSVAILGFFWGMIQFILHSGDQKTRDEGKQKMLWSIIALFVMLSIVGIIKFLGTTTGITPGYDVSLPAH